MVQLTIYSFVLISLAFFLKINFTSKIYFTIISLFFPIHIKILGKDAITTSSLFIFLLFIFYIRESNKNSKIIYQRNDLFFYIMILLACFSTAYNYLTGAIYDELVGRAIRRYLAFTGGILLCIVIKNYKNLDKNASFNNYFEESLLHLFFLLISFHILISILVQFVPQFQSFFAIFQTRDADSLVIESFGIKGRISRIYSFVLSYEALGETIGAIAPLVIYKIFNSRNMFWVIIYILLFMGVLLSGTRSGILLFIIGTLLSIPAFIKYNFLKMYFVLHFFAVMLLSLFYIRPFFLDNVLTRFVMAIDMFNTGGEFLEVTNRTFLADVFSYVLSEISLIGHGILLPAIKGSFGTLWFHNLYLTIIHQFGILGSMIFFILLLSPLYYFAISIASKDSLNKKLIFTCMLSLILFLINESKFEFVRYESYLQIWFAIIAIYYSVGQKYKTIAPRRKYYYRSQFLSA